MIYCLTHNSAAKTSGPDNDMPADACRLRPGARDLPIIRGCSKSGRFTAPREEVINELADILVASNCVFRDGDSVVYSCRDYDDGWSYLPLPLMVKGRLKGNAYALLANLFVCESRKKTKRGVVRFQFAAPSALLRAVLLDGPTLDRLPQRETSASDEVPHLLAVEREA